MLQWNALGCLHPTIETTVPVYMGNRDEIGVSGSFCSIEKFLNKQKLNSLTENCYLLVIETACPFPHFSLERERRKESGIFSAVVLVAKIELL